jgi:hypothetical protein
MNSLCVLAGMLMISFEGNRLIFSDKQAPEEDDQTVDRWTIVWEKAK